MAMQFKFFTMLTFIENTLLVVPPPSLSSAPSPLQVTTLTRRPNAKFSTSAAPRPPSSPSSAPTAPSSTRTTSSATGGSTWTAPSPPPSLRPRTTSLPRHERLPRQLLLTALQRAPMLSGSTLLLQPRTAWRGTARSWGGTTGGGCRGAGGR